MRTKTPEREAEYAAARLRYVKTTQAINFRVPIHVKEALERRAKRLSDEVGARVSVTGMVAAAANRLAREELQREQEQVKEDE